jgi:hypothetical protein
MRIALAFLYGMYEFRRGITWADPYRHDDLSYTAEDKAYDRGRELAHRLTFRRFDY